MFPALVCFNWFACLSELRDELVLVFFPEEVCVRVDEFFGEGEKNVDVFSLERVVDLADDGVDIVV